MNLTFHIYCKNKAFRVSNATLDVITRYLNTAEIHYNEKLWNFIRVLALDGQFDK